MPYENIVWIKMRLKLLHDPRFMDMCNERQQLLYLKLLLLAGKYENMIPNDPKIIRRNTNYYHKPSILGDDLVHLDEVFRGISVDENTIQFLNFNELHNFRKSHKHKTGPPKDVPEKRRVEESREEEKRAEKSKKIFIPPTVEEVKEYITAKQYFIDPSKWWNHYNSNGWKVGKNKMVSWHSAIATWLPEKNTDDGWH